MNPTSAPNPSPTSTIYFLRYRSIRQYLCVIYIAVLFYDSHSLTANAWPGNCRGAAITCLVTTQAGQATTYLPIPINPTHSPSRTVRAASWLISFNNSFKPHIVIPFSFNLYPLYRSELLRLYQDGHQQSPPVVYGV